jgi:hypothetical protein
VPYAGANTNSANVEGGSRYKVSAEGGGGNNATYSLKLGMLCFPGGCRALVSANDIEQRTLRRDRTRVTRKKVAVTTMSGTGMMTRRSRFTCLETPCVGVQYSNLHSY